MLDLLVLLAHPSRDLTPRQRRKLLVFWTGMIVVGVAIWIFADMLGKSA